MNKLTDIPDDESGFWLSAMLLPKEEEELSESKGIGNSLKEYGKTALKGSVEGLIKAGSIFGPTKELPIVNDEGINLGRSTSEIQRQQSQKLDELLPTEKSFGQEALRRGLREAPTAMLAAPGSVLSMLTRAIASGFLEEGSKELGAPEWVQSAAGLTAYIGPDLTAKLLAKGKNKELIEFGRRFGLSDKEITPLIQGETKQKWLSKITPKRGKTQEALSKTRDSLGKIYTKLENSPIASKSPPSIDKGKLISGIEDKLRKMPRKVQGYIKKDLKDLLKSEMTGEDIINFYKDINYNLGNRTKQLSLLKKPVQNALKAISPELASDFEMTNKLFSKYYPIANRLKPTLSSDISQGVWQAAKGVGLLGSIVTGNYPVLSGLGIEIGAEFAAKKLAQNMLINPRLQQLSLKTVKAMNEGKVNIAMKLTKSLANEIRKDSPEIADELDFITEEQLKEFFDKGSKSKD